MDTCPYVMLYSRVLGLNTCSYVSLSGSGILVIFSTSPRCWQLAVRCLGPLGSNGYWEMTSGKCWRFQRSWLDSGPSSRPMLYFTDFPREGGRGNSCLYPAVLFGVFALRVQENRFSSRILDNISTCPTYLVVTCAVVA